MQQGENIVCLLRIKGGNNPLFSFGVVVGGAKIRKKLRRWEGINISIRGQLTLINTVLASLLVHYFSTYRAPKKMVRETVMF